MFVFNIWTYISPFLICVINLFQLGMFAINSDLSGWDASSVIEFVSLSQYNMYNFCVFIFCELTHLFIKLIVKIVF